MAHFWSVIEQRARVQFLREIFVFQILSIVGLLSRYQREVSVSKFSKKGEGIQIFPLKRDGLVKIGKYSSPFIKGRFEFQNFRKKGRGFRFFP